MSSEEMVKAFLYRTIESQEGVLEQVNAFLGMRKERYHKRLCEMQREIRMMTARSKKLLDKDFNAEEFQPDVIWLMKLQSKISADMMMIAVGGPLTEEDSVKVINMQRLDGDAGQGSLLD